MGGTWPDYAEGDDIVYKNIAFLQKCDESLLVHNSCACSAAMEQIRMNFGPFDEDEILFYKRRLSDGDKCTINGFQRDLLFNLFFKYFGD